MSNESFTSICLSSGINASILGSPDESSEIIVFLPGGPGLSSTYMKAAAESITKKLLCRAIFLEPTHPGRTDEPQYPDLLEQLSSSLHELTSNGQKLKAVIAHSFGAMLFADHAVKQKFKVPKLILTSLPGMPVSSQKFRDQYNEIIGRRVSQQEQNTLVFGLYLFRPISAQKMNTLILGYNPKPFGEIFRSFPEPGTFYGGGALKIPGMDVLIVQGQNDIRLPDQNLDLLRTSIPNGKVATITNCGHFPMLERPVEFEKICLSFLAD